MKRHRTAVTGGAIALLALVIGLGAVTGIQAGHNRDLQQANAAINREKNTADRALEESEAARRRAEAVLDFLNKDVLATARPEGQGWGLGKDVTVRKAIDAAEPKVAEAFKDQPIIEAAIRFTFGLTYHFLGELPRAIQQYERVLELRLMNLRPRPSRYPANLQPPRRRLLRDWSVRRGHRALPDHAGAAAGHARSRPHRYAPEPGIPCLRLRRHRPRHRGHCPAAAHAGAAAGRARSRPPRYTR